MPSIHFFTEDLAFNLKSKTLLRDWLGTCAKKEGFSIITLNYIFTSDEYLLRLNQEYLNHDTFTDIVTFDNSEVKGQIEADVFISIPRVRENSTLLNTGFQNELCRVLVHGLLHLIGYSDKSPSAKKRMTDKEDECLSLLPQVPRETP